MTGLGLADLQFQPYSLRRGGSTFWFALHGSLDAAVLRGRWESVRTGRNYIQTANERLMKIKLEECNGALLDFYRQQWMAFVSSCNCSLTQS